MYNGKLCLANQLLRLRGHLVLECWKQVQEKKPFNSREVANIVTEITKSFEQLNGKKLSKKTIISRNESGLST